MNADLMTENENEEQNEDIYDEDQNDDQNFVYLTVDLAPEIVNKIKSLTTNDLEKMKQLGVISVQFESDPFKLKLQESPSKSPSKQQQQQQQQQYLNNLKKDSQTSIQQNLNSNNNLQNETKKRSRKTIMELTSGAYQLEQNRELTNSQPNRNKRNSKEFDVSTQQQTYMPSSSQLIQHQQINMVNHQNHSIPHPPPSQLPNNSSSSPYVLSSCIVDHSQNMNQNQFQYAQNIDNNSTNNKAFTMPSPMIANMLNNNNNNSNDNNSNSNNNINNHDADDRSKPQLSEKLMHVEDYKHIYDMRQQLANQVQVSAAVDPPMISQPINEAEKPKKQRRNADPNKPKIKRIKQPPKADANTVAAQQQVANSSSDHFTDNSNSNSYIQAQVNFMPQQPQQQNQHQPQLQQYQPHVHTLNQPQQLQPPHLIRNMVMNQQHHQQNQQPIGNVMQVHNVNQPVYNLIGNNNNNIPINSNSNNIVQQHHLIQYENNVQQVNIMQQQAQNVGQNILVQSNETHLFGSNNNYSA
jgi:hypothetical protein